MVGATFRKNSDLPPNAFASFGLSRQPDWSFADGTPGYLVSWQVVVNKQYKLVIFLPTWTFSEQGAAGGCGSHGRSELAGAPGAPIYEQNEFDEWHRESRGLKMYVAEICQAEESLQFSDHKNSRRNNVVIHRIIGQRKVV